MDEKEWIERIQKGEEDARDRFFTEFRHRLYATAVHFLGYQDPDAEDAVQEAYTRAFAGIAGFRGESGLYTWLNHICVNVCFDRVRRRNRNLLKEHEDLEKLSLKAARERHSRQQESDEQEEALEILRNSVNALGEPCGSLVRMRDLEGKSYAVVSKSLKIPMGTVMSRISRCRQSLKKIILQASKKAKP